MTVVVYGGSFNPPHRAHVRAARAAYEALRPDKFIVMPDADPPHKLLAEESPAPQERLELTRLAFRDFPEAEVSDLEIVRAGQSYTADTVEELQRLYPGAALTLVMGADMLLYFEHWYRFRWLLENAALAVLPREEGDGGACAACAEHLRRDYGARVTLLPVPPLPMSSSEVRARLQRRGGADELPGAVYARIIRERDYGAKPDLAWLREQAYAYLKPKRVPHVQGTEAMAAKLARRWGADEGDAAEAGILHDITKKLELPEQLILCERYGIMIDNLERTSPKLLHARTGAALSRDLFGVPQEICDAIRWHTTGKPAMTLLEKILYLADYVEPTRDFPGVEALRALAFEDLDRAMALGLSMCLEDVKARGETPYGVTCDALAYYGRTTA